MTPIDRRAVLAALTAAAAIAPLRGFAAAEAFTRRIPQRPSARVIVDNDFSGDPDGIVALAHHLLTPKTRTVLVTSSGLNPKFATMAGVKDTARAGRDVALETIRRLGIVNGPPVAAGVEPGDASVTEAARAIVAEALRDDPLPLYLCCGGPLTNVAAALRLEPRIAGRMTLVWIGGTYPNGAWEYNLATDVDAARYVVEETRVPLWQIPQSTYRQMAWSTAEMAADLRPISPFTRWLYDRFTSPPSFVDVGGAWPMGDSPCVLLTSITTESSRYVDVNARRLNPDFSFGAPVAGRTVRIYETVDARLVFADFLARLRLHAAQRR